MNREAILQEFDLPNVIWIDPTHEGEVKAAWVLHVAKQSKG